MKGSLPNEHGVYVDGLERITFKSKRNELEVRMALDASTKVWRYGMGVLINGPRNYTGLYSGPSARKPAFQTREQCLAEAVKEIRGWFANGRSRDGSDPAVEAARYEIEKWCDSIDPRKPQQKEMVFEEAKGVTA